MKPFDYQLDLINKIAKSMGRGNKRVIAQLSTGGGKTVCIAEIARRAISKGSVVCIACHREEIFRQIYNTLTSFGIYPSLIAPGSHPMPGSQVYLSMVETFCRRMDKGLMDKLKINFLILDEVHLGNYYKLVKDVNCHVLGFTATPKSTGKPELKEYFDDIVCGISLSELIKIGRLTPARTFSINHDFSKIKIVRGDYDVKGLMEEFRKPKLWNGAVNEWLRHAKGQKTLCYNVNVEQSIATCNQFRDLGFKAVHVDGETKNRELLFNGYKEGLYDIICNVGVATTGTDLPDTQCIIKNYATVSLVKDIQVSGRGARCSDGKKFFTIIDMGRNWIRHGKFGEEVDWIDIFNNPSKSIKKESSNKAQRECDECGAVIKFKLKMCPYCGDIISQQQMDMKIMEGMSTEEIREYKLQSLPPHLRVHPKEMNRSQLAKYAEHMGYNPKWAHKMRQIWKR